MKPTRYQNKTHWHLILVLTAVVCLAMSACRTNHQGESTILKPAIEILYKDTQGMRSEPTPSAVWLATDQELLRFYNGLKALKLEDASKPAPRIDFHKYRVLLIEMGQKPTGGYSLELNPDASLVDKDTLRIGIDWNEPASESVVPQVITSPTLLLSLEKGSYSSVAVVDQQGKVLFELTTID
jgi:hypothetical protein